MEGYGKLAQAMQVGTDPDSAVVFNLRLGDGMVEGGAVEVLASEALTQRRWWPSRAQTTRIARYRGDGATKVPAGAENAIAVSGPGGCYVGRPPSTYFLIFFYFSLTR